jgi:hypothetical protein
MTPRTMEERVFEVLQKERAALGAPLDLSLEGPLFNVQHPRVVSAQFRFENGEILEEAFVHSEWKAAFYKNTDEARRYHPEFQLLGPGSVKTFSELLSKKNESFIIDFSPLGTVALTQNSIEQGQSSGSHRTTLPHWLTYALSPELWGPVGKWTRFHERLHTLFDKYHLLNGKDFPGFYPLKPDARWLEEHGFKGTLIKDQFILNLNWTFPLSALEKIETVIRER